MPCATPTLPSAKRLKQVALSDIYRMLSYAYGSVPTTFDFEYRDKDKQYHRDADLTPQSFYQKYVGWALDDYVTIASTTEKPYWQSYALPAQDYVENGRPIRFVNVPQQTMEQLAVAQLKAGESVWFGNDVLADMDRDSGTLRGGLICVI
jgi:bleomycin hydrolase